MPTLFEAIASYIIIQFNPTIPVIQLDQVRIEQQIKNQVREEVNSYFLYTIILINLLLTFIVLFAILGTIYIWMIRKSLIQEISQFIQFRITKEIETEVVTEYHTKKLFFYQDFENIKYEVSHELNTIISEQKILLNELKKQSNKVLNNHNINNNESESEIIENNEPEMGNLTFSDYLNKGDQLVADQKYEEANKYYSIASKLDNNSAIARYKNAQCYALQRKLNLAIGNLSWAIDIDPSYRETAETDPAFNAIRNEELFKNSLTNNNNYDS